MIFNVPTSMRSDEALAKWVNGMGLKYPAQQICIGRQNTELASYVEEHEFAVRKLEMLLSTYLKGKTKKRQRRGFIIYQFFFFVFVYRRSGDTRSTTHNYIGRTYGLWW
jgi:hypothetical protein